MTLEQKIKETLKDSKRASILEEEVDKLSVELKFSVGDKVLLSIGKNFSFEGVIEDYDFFKQNYKMSYKSRSTNSTRYFYQKEDKFKKL